MGCAYGQNQNVQREGKRPKRIQQINQEENIVQNIKVKHHQMDSRTFKLISQTLKSHFFFFSLNEQEIQQIAGKMFYSQCLADQYLFKAGDKATCYLIIQSGQILIQQYKKILAKGDSFGQLALIYNNLRSASAKSVKPCKLWGLSRMSFKSTLSDLVTRTFVTVRPYIQNISVFKYFTSKQKDQIALAMNLLKFQKNQYIFKQGDNAQTFAIIKHGSISIQINGKSINTIQAGGCIGQRAFYQRSTRSASAVALQKVLILSIHRQSIQNILGQQVIKVVRFNINRWAMMHSTILNELTSIQIQKLVVRVQMKQAKQGQVVLQKGQCKKLVIATEISFVNQARDVKVQKGNLIGQKFLLTENKSSLNNQRLLAGSQGFYAQITHETVCNILGRDIESIIIQNKKKKENIKLTQVSQKQMAIKSLDEFVLIKKLGTGQFGKVYLVRKKDQQTLYALKCLQKQQIVENKMEKIIMEEKNILSLVRFPFIVSFRASHKDEYHLFLLMQHVRGMQLFDVLREIGFVKKPIARFYIATVILTIQYLHSNQIVYRDLKPQNLMVQSNGYIKMIDLGTAKRLNPKKGFRTFTMIGTPHYMGPQVLQGKGYSFATDLWAIGVLLYQFIYGHLPFAEKLEDPYEIYYQVMKSALKFPEGRLDASANKLIQQFLNKTPQSRLGRSFASIKNSAYFQQFDWQSLSAKTMAAPVIPEICKKEQQSLRKRGEEKPLSGQLSKQRKGLKKHSVGRWDAQF